MVSYTAEGGYWLIHSVPEFPPKRHLQYSYPESAEKHGHIHLCISLRRGQIDLIGNQLLYTGPFIYDQSVPEGFRTEALDTTLRHKHVDHMAMRSKYRQEFVSVNGHEFLHFAKSVKFQGEIYDSWLIPHYRSDFFAQCGKRVADQIRSLCRSSFKVLNIQKIKMDDLEYLAEHDHSKWAITPANHYICIGDVDRSRRSMTLGGGMMCFRNTQAWQEFDKMVVHTEQCPHDEL